MNPPNKKYQRFKPILDRILVRRLDEYTDGQIAVASKYRQMSNKGEVVEVGDFVVLGGIPVQLTDILKPGDIVLFGGYNAEKFDADGDDLFIVRIQDIRGVERLDV